MIAELFHTSKLQVMAEAEQVEKDALEARYLLQKEMEQIHQELKAKCVSENGLRYQFEGLQKEFTLQEEQLMQTQ